MPDDSAELPIFVFSLTENAEPMTIGSASG